MRNTTRALLVEAIKAFEKDKQVEAISEDAVSVEIPRDPSHGDYATNAALVSAQKARGKGLKPRDIANGISERVNVKDSVIESVSVAGPGFINVRLKPEAWFNAVTDIIRTDAAVQPSNLGGGKKVMVEFVSANPTGPIHVGHGRGAVVGDTVANILKKVGYDVLKEYYVNDAGSQVDKLAESVHARYLNLVGIKKEFPEDGYPGEYVIDVARDLKDKYGNKFMRIEGLFDPEERDFAISELLALIRNDLEGFGVYFDNWFSERSLYEAGMENAVREIVNIVDAYEKDDAIWLETSKLGDDKDRVLVKSNKELTYFAGDILYHKNKLERRYERLINVWGADHHGYIPRVKAAIKALGYEPDCLDVMLVQMVNLTREGKPVAMGKRTGDFVSMEEVVSEVGADAARFTFLLRSHTSQQEFDIELAKKQSSDNPVYYVQYAHARICSIFDGAAARGVNIGDVERADMSKLEVDDELSLAKKIVRYAEIIEDASRILEPHRITHYLIELAGDFHRYYNKNRVLTDDSQLTLARLALAKAIMITLRDGLDILGVSAPEKM